MVSSSTFCTSAIDGDHGHLAERSTPSGGIGVPASRLSAPLSRSIGIAIARFWKLEPNEAGGDHAGDEVLREADAALQLLPAEDRRRR